MTGQMPLGEFLELMEEMTQPDRAGMAIQRCMKFLQDQGYTVVRGHLPMTATTPAPNPGTERVECFYTMTEMYDRLSVPEQRVRLDHAANQVAASIGLKLLAEVPPRLLRDHAKRAPFLAAHVDFVVDRDRRQYDRDEARNNVLRALDGRAPVTRQGRPGK